MEKLAPEVKKRVEFLRNIQVQYDEFQSKFHEKRAALEAKYQKLYNPLYTMRYEIVNDLVEVEGVVDDSMEDIAAEDKANEGNKCVPGFWLTVIKANEDLTEEIEINEQDEDALKHLKDIKCSKFDGDQREFKLEFFFSSNPYFKNSMLSKTYIMFDDDDDDETIPKKAIGSEIEWFPGKCLTHKVIKKKRKKGLKNAKLITKIKKCSSFFNFFSPPNVPEENDDDFDEETYEQLEDQQFQDDEAGTIIRYKIIPHAVSWFTGEAKELEDIEEDEDDDDEDDSEEDEEDDNEEGDREGEEEDDDEDEDEDEEAKKRKRKLQNLVALMEKLAPEVKKRVEFLRNIQGQFDEFQSKFREERAALEAKYQKLYDPLCTMRYEIVNGLVEVEGVVDDYSMEDIAAEDKANEGNKGVPGFWLTAIKANEDLTEEIEINEQDEDALKHLTDIKCSKLDGEQWAFKLEFFFSPNPYFKNSVLSKTFLMFDDDDEPIPKEAIISEIEWFPRKCLTHKVIKKKPKKGLKNAKLITKIKKCSSFFNFFSPLNIPEENDVDFDEAMDDLNDDHEVGTIIRDKIIPHAVSWFTGEAIELDDIEGDEDDDDDDSEEDEEDDDEEGEEEDDDEDEDEEKEAKKRKFATGLKELRECKQAVVSEGLCLAS